MKNNSLKDLTTGSPTRLIISFMLPMLFGMVFQQLYCMVDAVVVGKFLGTQALAGVGSTTSISFLVIGFCNGLCAGFAIPVAQKFGQKDFDGLRKIVGNMIWLGIGIAATITLLTVILCRNILLWMNTPLDTLSYAYSYMLLIFLGIPTTMLYNLLSGIIRSLGDSKTPLYFLILCSLLNVAMDLLFILVFHMGVAGAGLATLVSQLISGLLCIQRIAARFPILHLSREDLKPELPPMRRLLNMGIPMGLQYSITAIGNIVLQTSINGLGSAVMAAVTVGGQASYIVTFPYEAIGSTGATFAGQNLGAGKPERVHAGVKSSAVMGTAYSVFIFIFLWFAGSAMAKLFLDTSDPQAMETILPMCRQILLVNAACYIPLLFVNLLRFTIQGLGFSGLAVFAGFFEMAARAFVGALLVPLWGFTAVCFANPAAWFAADIFLIPAYFYCIKKRGYDVFHTKHKN